MLRLKQLDNLVNVFLKNLSSAWMSKRLGLKALVLDLSAGVSTFHVINFLGLLPRKYGLVPIMIESYWIVQEAFYFYTGKVI